MEVLGIGPLELLLIFVLILVVLGPKQMVSGAKKLAEWIRKMRQSELFRTSKEIAEMPKKIMQETGLEKEISQIRDMSSRTMDGVIRQAMVEEAEPSKPKKRTTARKKAGKQPTKKAGRVNHDSTR